MSDVVGEPVLRRIVVGDEPGSWRAGGFDVAADGTTRLGGVTVDLVGRADGAGILSWSFAGLDAGGLTGGTIDGLPTSVTEEGQADPGHHPNGVTAIDHVVVASPDTGRMVAAFEAAGFVVRRVRDTGSYGAPMRQTFLRSGAVILELIGPEVPGGDGPSGFFGLAHTVADIDATAALLGAGLGAPKDAVQTGRRIATLRHRDVGMSVATAFLSPEPAR